jgi:hypothetical protein
LRTAFGVAGALFGVAGALFGYVGALVFGYAGALLSIEASTIQRDSHFLRASFFLLDSHHGCAQVFFRARIGLQANFFCQIARALRPFSMVREEHFFRFLVL